MSTDPRSQAREYDPAAEADAVRRARVRRDLRLTPAERLAKIAALCREAGRLQGARPRR